MPIHSLNQGKPLVRWCVGAGAETAATQSPQTVARLLATHLTDRHAAVLDIGCGTFTHGHVDARCLDELFRVLQPGAPFAFTVKLEVFDSLGFRDKLATLVQAGTIRKLEFVHDRHYATSEQPDGVFCVYARR